MSVCGALPVVVVALVAPGVVHGHAGLPIAAGVAGGGDELLGRLGVALVAAAEAVVVDDAGLELEQGNQLLGALLVHVHRRVPPEHGGELAVVGEDFLHLRHGDLVNVIVHAPLLGRVPLAAGGGAAVVPVLRLGVVEAELEAVFPAGGGEFLQRVAAKRARP